MNPKVNSFLDKWPWIVKWLIENYNQNNANSGRVCVHSCLKNEPAYYLSQSIFTKWLISIFSRIVKRHKYLSLKEQHGVCIKLAKDLILPREFFPYYISQKNKPSLRGGGSTNDLYVVQVPRTVNKNNHQGGTYLPFRLTQALHFDDLIFLFSFLAK